MPPRTSSNSDTLSPDLHDFPIAADEVPSACGPLSAEILIVGLDNNFSMTIPHLEMVHAAGLSFDKQLEGGGTSHENSPISARISLALASSSPDEIISPETFENRSVQLSREVSNMQALRLVIALGISAHMAMLGACGIPLSRMDCRPGKIIRLPDGLLIADAPHLSVHNLETPLGQARLTEFEALLPHIRNALRPSA